MENEQKTHHTSEEIFLSIARNKLFHFDIDGFKKKYKTLYSVILESMELYYEEKTKAGITLIAQEMAKAFNEQIMNIPAFKLADQLAKLATKPENLVDKITDRIVNGSKEFVIRGEDIVKENSKHPDSFYLKDTKLQNIINDIRVTINDKL